MNHLEEQKKIAKNTVFLYIRMIVVMFVALYTSRVVLDKLGVEDYGIYNIVGGVVVSFTFIKNSLMSATQRFISFSKGENNNLCSSVFSMSINVHLIILIIVIVVLETAGLWLFNNVIQIPDIRRDAASLVYQFSVFTFCFNLLQVPYSSLIISNEKMTIYAVLSIVDAGLKLLIAYLLITAQNMDKLVYYSIMMLLVTIIQFIINSVYCYIRLHNDCIYKLIWNKSLFKEMMSFSSWNLVGGLSGVATTEGPNYFINYYLGVRANAAMGIAKQVSNTVYGFSSNFQTAFNPQIVKAYASNDYRYLYDLVFRTSKLSFLLVYVVTLPLVICCNDVLDMWLTIIPEYTISFCVLILFGQIISSVSSPFWMAAHAIGDIKNYQLVLVLLNLSLIPSAWLIMSFGWEPECILGYQILINIIVLIYRVDYLKRKLNFPSKRYYKEVILKCCVIVFILSYPICYVVSLFLSGVWKIILTTIVSILVTMALFYFVGLNVEERLFFRNLLDRKFNRE